MFYNTNPRRSRLPSAAKSFESTLRMRVVGSRLLVWAIYTFSLISPSSSTLVMTLNTAITSRRGANPSRDVDNDDGIGQTTYRDTKRLTKNGARNRKSSISIKGKETMKGDDSRRGIAEDVECTAEKRMVPKGEKRKKREREDSKRKGGGQYRPKGRKYNNYASKLTNGAVKLTKSSFKNAFDLVSQKNVNIKQIVGKWKISQEVRQPSGAIITCPATIEIFRNGSVVTKFNGELYVSDFVFTERNWPHFCKIEFSACAFQGPRDKRPQKMVYKGSCMEVVFIS